MKSHKNLIIQHIRPALHGLALVLSCLIFAVYSGTEARAKDLLNRTLNTPSLFVINDKQGEIRLTGFGDRKTHFYIIYKMEGFYIISLPNLRMMLDSGVKPSKLKRLKLEDIYYVTPKRLP